MPPDHDHFSGSVNLDDACQLRKFPQLSWVLPMRPQSRWLAEQAPGST
jgi:hypothetical protein